MSENGSYKEILVSVPRYENGLGSPPTDDDVISVHIEREEVIIWANPSGLHSLALRLLSLAEENVPDGYHFHLSSLYGLEEASNALILGRRDDPDRSR